MSHPFVAWCAACLDRPAAVFVDHMPLCKRCEHTRSAPIPTANILEAFKCP